MANIGKKLVIDSLSENILNTRFEDLDKETVSNAKKRILDVIGEMIGAVPAPGNAALVKMVENWGGKKEATIIGYGVKGTVANVAMVNCILCRSFDWEPLVVVVHDERYPSHTSCTTVPTAITVGESKGISGKELITALMVGDDLAARLTSANMHPWNASMQNRLGFDTRQMSRPGAGLGAVTTFGATAIAGRLFGLNVKQMRDAFGVALDGSGGGSAGIWDGSTTFKMSQGTTARNAITAVILAKGGWYGGIDPLFGERGSFYGPEGCDYPEVFSKDLGRKYYQEVVFKPYPGGRPTHTNIDAAIALATKHDIDIDDIEEVILHLSVPAKYGHYMRPYKVGGDPTADALFSYQFSTCSALYRRAAISKYYTPEYIRDPKLQALIGKFKLADSDKEAGVELEVKMKDGRTLTEYAKKAIGEVPNALSKEFIIKKFMTQVEFSSTVTRDNAEKIIEMVDRLEEVDNIQKLVTLAVKP